jgi:hypothetical protein
VVENVHQIGAAHGVEAVEERDAVAARGLALHVDDLGVEPPIFA